MAPTSDNAKKRTPIRRPLRVFAYDPSLATELENFDVSEVSVDVRWEENLQAGPVGEYLEVVDVDPASGCAYAPVDLNDPTLLAEDGLAPSEGNPQFHQQMTYAVAMSTIQHFERALGRSILWSDQRLNNKRPEKDDFVYTDKLRIYPHALRENNAYYDPSKKALLFGYFPSQPAEVGLDMPGGLVFSCLSHDIIAHETTHAILDGVQPYFLEPTNVDVLAFHEAFADIVALFEHFTYPEILRRQIARARGDLTSTETLLGQLAMQFGKATGGRSALRDSIGQIDKATGKWRRRTPDPNAYQTTTEPHARGALFVAAVFDVFLAIYRHRTRDLLRIATGGTGILPDGDLHPDLVARLADEAAKTAQHLLTICIRAIDYCPPVDITFGDYVRALVTADVDVMPVDKRNYRVAIIESFRRWGIYPENVRTLSVESLVWNAPDTSRHSEALSAFVDNLQLVFDDTVKRPESQIPRAWSDLRNGAVTSGLGGDVPRAKLTRKQIWDRTKALAIRVHEAIAKLTEKVAPQDLNELFGLDFGYGDNRDRKFQIATVRPVRRPSWDGRTKDDVLLQIVQSRSEKLDPSEPDEPEDSASDSDRSPRSKPSRFKFRGGITLIIDLETRAIRYAITKSLFSERRLARQRDFMLGVNEANERALYFGQTPNSQQLAALHVCHH